MRQIRANKLLGIAITEQAFLVAEVVSSGESRELRRFAEFRYPDGKLPADMTTLGRPFGQFLKQNGFQARAAVVGVPASWVMVRPKMVPPSDPTTAASVLRLQAESEFSSEFKDMVYDYAGQTDRDRPRQVLLMAMSGDRITQINEMAHIARVAVEAITPSVVALASASKTLTSPEGLVIYVAARSAEMVFQNSRGLQRVRSVSLVGGGTPIAAATAEQGGQEGNPPAELQPAAAARPVAHELASELRRTLVSLPQNGTPAGARKIILWDGTDMDTASRTLISERIGLAVAPRSVTELGVSMTTSAPQASRFVPAVALAMEPEVTVDFLHPRLAAPAKGMAKKWMVYGIVLGALLLVGAGYSVYDLTSKERERSTLEANYKLIEPKAKVADAAEKKLAFVKTFGESMPRFLNCLYAITTCFPDDTSAAWTTNLEIRRDMSGTLSGKATSMNTATWIVDRMKNSKQFKDVKGDYRENARSREVSFTVNFVFSPTE